MQRLVILLFCTGLLAKRTLATTCSASAQALDTCIHKITDADEFKGLNEKRRTIVQACFDQNPSLKGCPVLELEKCQHDANDDSTVQSAKETLFTQIDGCLSATPPDVFFTLHKVMDGLEGGPFFRKAYEKGKNAAVGGAVGPEGGGTGIGDLKTFTIPPIFTNIFSGAGGGGSHGAPGGSNGGGNSGGGLGSLGSLFGQGTGGLPNLGNLGNIFQTIANGANGGGRRKRAEEGTSSEASASFDVSQCTGLQSCVQTAELQASTEEEFISKAKKVYADHIKCVKSNSPKFDCAPSTPDHLRCLSAAFQTFVGVKTNFMKQCVAQEQQQRNSK